MDHSSLPKTLLAPVGLFALFILFSFTVVKAAEADTKNKDLDKTLSDSYAIVNPLESSLIVDPLARFNTGEASSKAEKSKVNIGNADELDKVVHYGKEKPKPNKTKHSSKTKNPKHDAKNQHGDVKNKSKKQKKPDVFNAPSPSEFSSRGKSDGNSSKDSNLSLTEKSSGNSSVAKQTVKAQNNKVNTKSTNKATLPSGKSEKPHKTSSNKLKENKKRAPLNDFRLQAFPPTTMQDHLNWLSAPRFPPDPRGMFIQNPGFPQAPPSFYQSVFYPPKFPPYPPFNQFQSSGPVFYPKYYDGGNYNNYDNRGFQPGPFVDDLSGYNNPYNIPPPLSIPQLVFYNNFKRKSKPPSNRQFHRSYYQTYSNNY